MSLSHDLCTRKADIGIATLPLAPWPVADRPGCQWQCHWHCHWVTLTDSDTCQCHWVTVTLTVVSLSQCQWRVWISVNLNFCSPPPSPDCAKIVKQQRWSPLFSVTIAIDSREWLNEFVSQVRISKLRTHSGVTVIIAATCRYPINHYITT